MTTNKTVANDSSVIDFLSTLDEEQQRDSQVLATIMSDVSGEPPVMWGASIIGFGVRRYTYASGRTGDWMRIGFSPRKGKLSLYITVTAEKYESDLEKVGKHKIGKGCIYINKLADIDQEALTAVIRKAYQDSFEA